MKKQFFNLGKALNKAEQKSINGGLLVVCPSESEPCRTGRPVPQNCITNVALCCVDGKYAVC